MCMKDSSIRRLTQRRGRQPSRHSTLDGVSCVLGMCVERKCALVCVKIVLSMTWQACALYIHENKVITLSSNNVEAEARDYWDALGEDQKTARLAVGPGHWDFVQDHLDDNQQPLTSEPTLRFPFEIAFQRPHNIAIRDAGDVRAAMLVEG